MQANCPKSTKKNKILEKKLAFYAAMNGKFVTFAAKYKWYERQKYYDWT